LNPPCDSKYLLNNIPWIKEERQFNLIFAATVTLELMERGEHLKIETVAEHIRSN